MFRFVTVVVTIASAIVVGSAAYAQDTPHPRSKPSNAPPAAAQQSDDPKDITAVPQNVQKWIGGAVDDFLTGADKTLEPAAGKR